MNAVDILNRCRDAIGEIKRLEARKARLLECATNATSRLNPTGGSRSGMTDKVSGFAADIDECDRALSARRRAYDVELRAACRLVDMLPEPECGVLYRYYVQGQTVGGIVSALNYSPSYVKQTKRSGLRAAEAIPREAVAALLPDWYRREYGED
jgi:hypothetical protein